MGDPIGGTITNYLLEKSRIVHPAGGERSFHIFYQLLYGLSQDELRSYHLDQPPDFFNYLRKSGEYRVNKKIIITFSLSGLSLAFSGLSIFGLSI